MDNRYTLTLVASLCFGILVLLWFAWSQFTSIQEENFRATIGKDLAEAVRTYDLLKVHTVTTKKHYEIYQAAIDQGTAEGRSKTWALWTITKEQECELVFLLRNQIATIERKVKDRSGRVVPEWIRLHRDWQMLKEHLRESEFY